MSGKEIRLGVIGAAGRGRLIRHAHKPGEGSRVVACCDLRPEVREDVKEWYGEDCFFTTDYKELLEQDIDGVFITTPDFLHEEHAVAALNAKIAVFLEKPMAITIEGADNIIRASKENGVPVMVGHNMRFMGFVLEMKRIIDSGMIGEVKQAWCRHFVNYGGDAYFRDWHSERKNQNTLLLQKGAHDIDVLHFLCGGYSTRVTAMGDLAVYDKCARRSPDERGDPSFNNDHWPPLEQTGFSPVIDVEDMNMMLMQLDNGVQACYLQNHFTPDNCRNYTIIGTHGRIENIGDYPDAIIRVFSNRIPGYGNHPSNSADYELSLKGGAGGHGGADPNIVADFLRMLREGGEPGVPVIAARNAVAAGVKAAESLRNGSMPQDIPPLADDLR